MVDAGFKSFVSATTGSETVHAPRLSLRDGHAIPQLGLGVWQMSPDQACDAVKTALAAGYRHIDTASVYANESGVGRGLSSGDVLRNEIFVTTKVANADQGYDQTLRAFDESLSNLSLEYVDLYLVHWPMPAKNLYVATWKALVRLKADGRIRSIGVSNFDAGHIERLADETAVVPVLNQIELHPSFQQVALREYHKKLGIVTVAWSPLGQGASLSNPTITKLSVKHKRSPAQIIIRWHIQNDCVAIPKSITTSRIIENLDVFSFQLDAGDMQQISQLDSINGRLGPIPATYIPV